MSETELTSITTAESLNIFSGAIPFFEEQLRKNSPCRLSREYPLAFRPENGDHIFLSQGESGRAVAGLATLERKIEVEEGLHARALFVGSVITDEKYRFRGLQRLLFDQVEAKAREWGIDFIVLWSNQIEFYAKLGFFLGGLQASWFLSEPTKLNSTYKGSDLFVDGSGQAQLTAAHFEAYQSKKCRVVRTFDEMSALWKIPQMKIATTQKAYALMGKGEDFDGVIHEWAGPTDEVIACIEALRSERRQVRLLSPGVLHDSDEREVVGHFEEAGLESRLEYLGLIKILSPRFFEGGFEPEDLRYPFFIWGLDSI